MGQCNTCKVECKECKFWWEKQKIREKMGKSMETMSKVRTADIFSMAHGLSFILRCKLPKPTVDYTSVSERRRFLATSDISHCILICCESKYDHEKYRKKVILFQIVQYMKCLEYANLHLTVNNIRENCWSAAPAPLLNQLWPLWKALGDCWSMASKINGKEKVMKFYHKAQRRYNGRFGASMHRRERNQDSLKEVAFIFSTFQEILQTLLFTHTSKWVKAMWRLKIFHFVSLLIVECENKNILKCYGRW